MIDRLGFMGEITITSHYKDGTIKRDFIRNRITNAGLNEMVKALDGTNDIALGYFAIGTGTGSIDDTDTTLGNETFRTSELTASRTGTGEFTSTYTVIDSEAVGVWEEIGFFGGSGASASADSGTMLSRILYSREKTSLEEIDITYKITLVRN
jgi:hypothetical protein